MLVIWKSRIGMEKEKEWYSKSNPTLMLIVFISYLKMCSMT